MLHDSNGEITTINGREFSKLLEMEFDGVGVRRLLCGHGIDIGEQVVEKTGLIALAGTLKMIDKGEIACAPGFPKSGQYEVAVTLGS